MKRLILFEFAGEFLLAFVLVLAALLIFGTDGIVPILLVTAAGVAAVVYILSERS